MTPQLQQAIKMLQLSNLELTDFVDAEIQQNPLLERGERAVGEISEIKSLTRGLGWPLIHRSRSRWCPIS